MRLEGKNIIVTGSTTGIGRTMARRFVREGARVLIHGTNRSRGEAMLQELGSAAALHLDPLDDPSSPARIVAAALAAFGSLDAVVNNAASVPKSVLESVTVESFEQTMAVNTLAPLLLTQAALPALKQTQGCILNIGSVNAYCGEPGLLVYSMTKGAMQTMTRNLGDTLHREYLVRVNQINPGWVITDNELERKQEHGVRPGWEKRVPKMFAPSGSIIDPEVIASAAVYFLGDESRPVSGSVVELEQYPMIGRNPPKAEE
jgi:NAD(P)-dependent dehydrogenase (short-subunit alcohol dehydrogenase family)